MISDREIVALLINYEIDKQLLAKFLNVDVRSVDNWTTNKSSPNATAQAIMIGMSEALKKAPLYDRRRMINEIKSLAKIGGMPYLIIRMFDDRRPK